MKHIKKLVTITLIIVLCVLIYYRYANKDSSRDINKVENDSLSEVERVLTKNLDEYYPKTPLEVVKFFTRIQKCYYNEDNTDEIVNELADLAKKLMDEELLISYPSPISSGSPPELHNSGLFPLNRHICLRHPCRII